MKLIDTRTLTAPMLAAGIFLGSALASSTTAQAQPTAGSGCSTMTMTDGRGGPNPSALTRAGQVGAASGAGASDGSMAVACEPATHG